MSFHPWSRMISHVLAVLLYPGDHHRPADDAEGQPQQCREHQDRLVHGSDGAFKGGWDLTKIGGVEPADLRALVEDSSLFCPRP